MIRVVRLLMLIATLVGLAPTTTASAATFTYDVPTVARVGGQEYRAAEASAARLSVAREESAPPSAEPRGPSTTPSSRSVATNTALDIGGANFAQTTASGTFSSGGSFAGQTIDDVAGALQSGAMSVKDVPIQVIVQDGNTLILNTRSALALEQAGIPRSAWNVVNMTGDAAAQARLAAQLARNGLVSTGTGSVRITGGG